MHIVGRASVQWKEKCHKKGTHSSAFLPLTHSPSLSTTYIFKPTSASTPDCQHHHACPCHHLRLKEWRCPIPGECWRLDFKTSGYSRLGLTCWFECECHFDAWSLGTDSHSIIYLRLRQFTIWKKRRERTSNSGAAGATSGIPPSRTSARRNSAGDTLPDNAMKK